VSKNKQSESSPKTEKSATFDRAELAEAHKKFYNGEITFNDYRAAVGLKPIEDGDVFLGKVSDETQEAKKEGAITKEKLVALAERGAKLIPPESLEWGDEGTRTALFQMPDGMLYSFEHISEIDLDAMFNETTF